MVPIIRPVIQSVVLCLAVAVGVVSSAAHAVAIGDVTFQIQTKPYQAAAVASLDGNDSVAKINALDGSFEGDDWFLLEKADGIPNVFEGVTFDLTADVGDPGGDWVLSWAGTGEPGALPLNMDFVFVTKASGGWGAYLFESILFPSEPLTGDGTFEITWVNGGGKTPNLSHASIYGRSVDSEPGPGPGLTPVPVPGTGLLLGLGLIPLGWMRRRRR